MLSTILALEQGIRPFSTLSLGTVNVRVCGRCVCPPSVVAVRHTINAHKKFRVFTPDSTMRVLVVRSTVKRYDGIIYSLWTNICLPEFS